MQLHSLDDIFISNGFGSKNLTEFILMDVIVNRKITPTAAAALGGSCGTATATSGNRDEFLFHLLTKTKILRTRTMTSTGLSLLSCLGRECFIVERNGAGRLRALSILGHIWRCVAYVPGRRTDPRPEGSRSV